MGPGVGIDVGSVGGWEDSVLGGSGAAEVLNDLILPDRQPMKPIERGEGVVGKGQVFVEAR